jgi:hypothetical protein
MAQATQQPRYPQAGAQAQQPAGPKILRIGLIIGDKIVEERLVRDRQPVTIGQSSKNSFAVPSPDLPKSWPLFTVAGGRYVLQFAESMDGRISDGGQVHTLAQLKSTGRANRSGAAFQLPLTEGARGKIVVGDMTLLFQFVTAPPPRPRPQLPHSVRGSLADQIDPYMAVVLVVSLLIHSVAYGYFKYIRDEPRKYEPDEIPQEFAQALMAKPEPPKIVAATGIGDQKGEEAGEQKGEDTGDSKGSSKDHGESKDDGPKGAPDRAAVAQAVNSTAVIRVLGTRSASGGGSFMDVSGGQDVGGDLAKGLDRVGAGGGTVAAVGTGDGLGTGTRGSATGVIAAGTQTTAAGPKGPTTTGTQVAETEVKVTGSTGDASGDSSGSLNPQVFEDTIKDRYYSRALKCYQNAAKTNPGLKGKVNVSITVGPGGNVTKVSVDGFDSSVDSCINTEARKWRFPKPDEASTFEFSFIFRPA